MAKITTVGLDLAKQVFHAVCCDARGKVVRKRMLRRAQVREYFSKRNAPFLREGNFIGAIRLAPIDTLHNRSKTKRPGHHPNNARARANTCSNIGVVKRWVWVLYRLQWYESIRVIPRGMACSTACPKTASFCRKPKPATTDLCAIEPKANTTPPDLKPPSSADRKSRHWLISAPTGLFCGGRHLTALVIQQPISCRPSSAETDSGALAKPYLCRVWYSRMPA